MAPRVGVRSHSRACPVRHRGLSAGAGDDPACGTARRSPAPARWRPDRRRDCPMPCPFPPAVAS